MRSPPVWVPASMFVLLAAATAHAKDVCIGPLATGNGSGSDWGNLKAWSNAPERGDTWYLADGAYSGKILAVPASGSTVIAVKKATVADHGPPAGWSDGMGDGQATFLGKIDFESPYWLFDGQSGG